MIQPLLRSSLSLLISIALTGAAMNIAALNSAMAADPDATVAAEQVTFFNDHVLPILKSQCYECHAGEHAKGSFKLDTRASLVSGGDTGTAVNFEEPEKSLLLEAIRYESLEMPPKGKLPAEQIEVLARWVAMGTPYPEAMLGDAEQSAKPRGKVITDKDKAFWSFQPLSHPQPPSLANAASAWAATPVDSFIEAKLHDAGLQANELASPAAAIRRLHFDLTGLPPPMDLVDAFNRDPSDRHWMAIVDRLLASPEYGERWGRHWLDLVRYAETNSYERDGEKPEAWRYRDWVIRALNDDLPYDEFIRDQLAGDERPFTPDRLIATGFYRLGIWDDEPVDAEQARFDDLDDIITTTSQVFLGLTLNCARCHDHKIDPITQRDYYRMAAFFAGVNRYGVRSHESVEQFSLRPLLPPAEGQVHMEAVARYQKRKQALENSQREIEKAVREDLTNVEKEEFRHAMNRYPLIAKRVGKVITAEQAEEYRVNTEQLALLEREKPATLGRALCITEMGSQPGPMHVRIRGSANALGEEVVPGYPEVLTDQLPTIPPSPSDKTSGRRSVLADWITSKSNPLTARVMANRLWHYHFGRGLVRSPNDFGYQGTAPSHPELLDYLAGELIRADWQLKPVHRQLLLSKTYRLSSASQAKAYEKDPLNDLFWRYDPRRLTAEEIRDSMLAATGQLNLAKFGMWMYPTIEQEVLAGQSRPGSGWGRSSAADQSRRSIYVHIKRSLAVPLLAAFDSAEPDFSCPARFATTQPTQALGMLNSNFLQTCSKQLAEHAKRLGGDLRDAQVAAALRQVTQREPTKIEIDRGVKLIERLQSEQAHSADDALQRFCLIALNLNEFLYLD